MSEKISNQEEQHSEKHTSDLNTTDETVYNAVKKEDRKLKVHDDEDEMEEFNSWNKKYNFIAKEIRKNAIEQEKRELENLKKSPITKYKYFEGSREDRILQLDEEKKLLDDMENLAKAKDKKKTKKVQEKSAPSSKEPRDSAGTTNPDEEKEDPEFRKMRKEYHETSKEMRKKSLHIEKNELRKQQTDELDYVPGSPKDRLRTVGGEVKGLEKIRKLKAEKEKKEKKNKDHK